MPGAVVLSLVLVLVGAGLVYAGARHQRLAARGGPRPVLRRAGAAALGIALIVMAGWFGAATAVFAWTTLAMLVWSVVPLAAAWRRAGR